MLRAGHERRRRQADDPRPVPRRGEDLRRRGDLVHGLDQDEGDRGGVLRYDTRRLLIFFRVASMASGGEEVVGRFFFDFE